MDFKGSLIFIHERFNEWWSIAVANFSYQPSHHEKAPLLPPKKDPTSINPTRVNIQKDVGKLRFPVQKT